MRYIHQHISSIIEAYDGAMPLSHFLRFYFKQHPILGSRDRKLISEALYCYYRCAKGLSASLSEAEKVSYSLLIAESNREGMRKLLPEALQEYYGKDTNSILSFLKRQGVDFDPDALFPYTLTLSEGISKEDWLRSMLHKPDLFIRLQPRYTKQVTDTLNDAQIAFEQLDQYCLRLPNGTALEKILAEKMYRVQDASSQKTGSYFRVEDQDRCWDCCSGAGGKSLLVMDQAPDTLLSVSDVRRSILDNLAERFRLYGHILPERIVLSVADKAQVAAVMKERRFEQVIADVPCSGSGTWARTPEQLYFFNTVKLTDFTTTQKAIAANVVPYVRPGGTFTYITCSVFTAENEEVVRFLLSRYPELVVKEQQLINGIALKADSMFIAVFEKK